MLTVEMHIEKELIFAPYFEVLSRVSGGAPVTGLSIDNIHSHIGRHSASAISREVEYTIRGLPPRASVPHLTAATSI